MKCVCVCVCTEGTCVVYLLESRTTYECSLSKGQILFRKDSLNRGGGYSIFFLCL